MENGPFIGDCPIKASVHRGFSSQLCLIARGQSIFTIFSPTTFWGILFPYQDSIRFTRLKNQGHQIECRQETYIYIYIHNIKYIQYIYIYDMIYLHIFVISYCNYPPVIKHGNGKSTINGGFNGKIIHQWWISSKPSLITGGYIQIS